MGGLYHDVSVVGPGIWTIIHMLAANAQTPSDVQMFVEYMNFLAEHFPCDKCRVHIQKFIRTHPFSNYAGEYIDGKEVGYFRLTWYLHSAVNERLGKPFFPFDTAYSIYFKNDTCMEVCPGLIDDTPVTKSQTTKKAIKRKMLTIK